MGIKDIAIFNRFYWQSSGDLELKLKGIEEKFCYLNKNLLFGCKIEVE